MNRENLKKLADYLLSGDLKAEFDMKRFSWNDDDLSPDCGSCGCAIGHGPFAGIGKKWTEGWGSYGDRNFIDYDENRDEWTWCFHCDWDRIDNTAMGAGKRIKWLLENGLPENWYKQLYGFEPLCYEV